MIQGDTRRTPPVSDGTPISARRGLLRPLEATLLIVGYGVAVSLAATSPTAFVVTTTLALVPVAVIGGTWGSRAGLLAGAIAAVGNVEVGRILVAQGSLALPATVLVTMAMPLPVVGGAIGWARELWDRARPGPSPVVERADLETALDIAYRRVRYEEAVIECTRALLTTTEADEVEAALRQLAQAVECDAVMVVRNETDEGRDVGRVVHWVRRDPHNDDHRPWPVVDYADVPHVAKRLASGLPFDFSSTDELPEPDRSTYEQSPAGIAAALHIPVISDGRWQGHVTFAHHSRGRRWRPNEVDLLRAVGDLVGTAWGRQDTMDRLRAVIAERDLSLRVERALAECSYSLLEGETDEPIERALKAVIEATGATTAFVSENIDHDGEPASRIVQWVGVAPRPEATGAVAWTEWPNALEMLRTGRPFEFCSRNELPPVEEAYFHEHGIDVAAELVYPIMVDGSWVGIVGIAATAPRAWNAADHQVLDMVARMLAAWWRRDTAREALEDLVRAKDRFIASVSHELRTPMSVVVGLSAELAHRWDDFTAEEVEEFIDLIARQSREVSHIIEDLLVSARAQETELTVRPEIFRLDQQVTRVIDDLPSEYTWRISGLDLEATATFADPLRVRQIIRNLIVNSHRYGGENVYVTVRADGEEAVLRVSDDGPGVPPERRDEIFEAYRSVNTMPGRTAAIGLGLTVSRQLARLMGGDVVYRRDELSAFELHLPLANVTVSVEADA